MKKILFILLLFVSFQSMGQRFPSIDSLQTYILKYFRNSTVETFTNLRGQNIVYGTTEFLEDVISGSGVDSIWIVDGGSDADTLRYRRWSVTYTAGLIQGGGAGISDGDKGDITVSSSGSVWTIDNLAVTNAKINDVAWSKITGVPAFLLTLNGLTGSTQTFATGTSGSDFNISSASTTHTFNLPTASASNRGALSSTDWSLFNSKLSYHLIVSATNLGSGAQVFKDTSSNKINLRSISVGWNTIVTQNTDDITISVDTTTQTLTDGATVTFNANTGVSAKVTLGGNRTLAFSNFRNGMFLSLLIIQDGTGGRTITLPASTRVINGGAGAVTLTTAASSHDILTFWKINDIIYCNYGKNYN